MISRHDINTDWKKRELVINGAGHTHIVKQRQKTNKRKNKKTPHNCLEITPNRKINSRYIIDLNVKDKF